MPKEPHEPVLVSELLALFDLGPAGRVADLTVGAGGHAAALLARLGTEGSVLGLDRDPRALELARVKLGSDPRVRLARARFSEFATAAAKALGEPSPAFDAILLDLGVSSMQLDEASSGFSFLREGPLDLRMNPAEGGLTAADLVNTAGEAELSAILFEFGEERASRRVAHRIVEERTKGKILTTTQLAALVRSAVPYSKADAGRIHPATRTFQALRIVVNNEVGELETGLAAALAALAPDGKLAVLSYHSIEDRIVKYFFRDAEAKGGFTILTKRPVRPGDDEIARNPRSRSAKLRVLSHSVKPAKNRYPRGGA